MRAAIREDRDIDPDDHDVAKWFIDRQMDAYHSITVTLFGLACSVWMFVRVGLFGVAYADWIRIMWSAGAVFVLIYSVSNVLGRVRTAHWIARHELVEVS